MKLARYIIGLASGLTFGMLFAPKRGKDLRKELMSKKSDDPAETCHEGFKVLGGAFKEAGEDAWSEIKSLGEHEQVAALLELSQEKMRAFLDHAEEKGYDVATVVQEKLEGLASLAKEKAGDVKVEVNKVKKTAGKVKATAKKVKARAKKIKAKAIRFEKKVEKEVKKVTKAKKPKAKKATSFKKRKIAKK